MELNIKSRYLKEFIKEIQFNNRNPQDVKAIEFLNDISTNPERYLCAGTLLYRSRIITEKNRINKIHDFYGFDAKESFVPPSKETRDMRANYRYIPYLYCSSHPYTSVVEVRPRLGASVSVATIRVNENIRLLDFTMQKVSEKMTQAKVNFFSDLSMLYSYPITSDDVLEYIPTQFIAEYAKHLGYDGIAFRSSLTPKKNNMNADTYNVVVFNYQKCEPIKSNVVEITSNIIHFKQTDNDLDLLQNS